MSEDKFLGNLYQRFPVTIDRGLGAHVWDTNNKEYIDCMGGYGVALLGHRNAVSYTHLTLPTKA